MRLILFFDLPVKTSKDLKAYRVFVKNIKKNGFYMLQESVYVKLCIDKSVAEAHVKNVRQLVPSDGSVIILTITEKQFNSLDILIGDMKSEVINSDERFIEL